jgi:hypothetical protein
VSKIGSSNLYLKCIEIERTKSQSLKYLPAKNALQRLKFLAIIALSSAFKAKACQTRNV